MPAENFRRRALRKTLLGACALVALPAAGFAADVPATPEGAQKLTALFEKYVGKSAAGAPPSFTLTPEDGHYTLAVDLAALTAPMKASGFSYDPATLTFALTEQSDGLWRYDRAAIPALSFHMKDGGSGSVHFADYKSSGLFDPALGWYKTIEANSGTVQIQVKAPGVDENISVGGGSATGTGMALADGAVATAVHEDLADLSGAFAITPGGANPKPDAKPIKVAFKSDKMSVDIALDGLKAHPLLDLWAFAAAHPSRPELAANEAALKDLLRAALPASFKLAESFALQSLSIETAQGVFTAAGGKGGIGASGSGAENSFDEHFAIDGLALPTGLVPPMFAALTPTAAEIGFKVSGFDLNAGATEAISDMHLAGDGPVISADDRPKVEAKFKGAGPIVIDIAPSHILAPQLDLSYEGHIVWSGAKPTGTVTVHARNFDKTVAAIKALGPMATPQMLGGLTMAKGLAKTESDGTLTWVGALTADGAMSVNGLPLGKAPI
jgi:hypothetical protein